MWALTFSRAGSARLKTFALAVLACGASACSLSSVGDDSSLHVDLSGLRGGSRFSLLDSGSAVYGLGAPPQSSTSFACYAVNVTGPGIGDSSPNPHPAIELGPIFDKLLSRSSYCSYRGVASPPLSLANGTATDVALQVPPGGVRLVQLVGVNDPLVCQSGTLEDPPGSTGGNRYFEVGRAVLNDVFGDQSVSIASDWPSATADSSLRDARMMDCGGGCGVTSTVVQNAAATGASINASTLKIAFPLTNVPGKTMQNITVVLGAYGTAGTTLTAQMMIAKKMPGDAMANLTPVLSSPATASVAASSTIPYATASFNLFDAATNVYPVMASGVEYWAVLSAPGASSSPFLSVIHNGGSGVGHLYMFDGTTWSSYDASDGVVHSLVGCFH